jgi:concanavalin A-like lectin/glucanase superfamily protein
VATRAKNRSFARTGWSCAIVAAALLVVGSAPAAAGDTTWTLAGTGAAADSGDGGQAREAAINQPRSIFATPTGGFVWAEPWSNRVRIVDANGIVRTLAGTGTPGSGGDGGPAAAADLNFVHSAAPTPDGGFLVADTLNSQIRKISAGGTITTVAGIGSAGFSGDGGPATQAAINNPRGVLPLADGSYLIPDSNNHRVRKVSATGIITTIAGTGTQGFSGDGGPAMAAQLSIPFGVAPTADGGFLIVDVGNQRIRKVSAAGVITTVAGNGVAGYGGDGGPATAASLRDPHNVVVLSDSSFLIADASNQRVRKVGTDGVITTVMGDGVRGYTGDGGPAAAAQLSVPKGIAVSGGGDILIADEQNNRIRFIGSVVAPANTIQPTISGSPDQGQQLTANAGGWSGTGPQIAYQWQRCTPACADISGATASAYAVVAADLGTTLRVGVTGSNVTGNATAYSTQTSTVGGAASPPVNTSPPTITGTPEVGRTLTASDGTWTGTQPLAFSYQWKRCNAGGGACTSIAGATSTTYLVAAADVDSTLRVTVTASNGSSVYATAVGGDAPRSYWRFGGLSGGLVDQQGVGNGTFAGSPQRGVTGLLTGDPDTAVTFNGTSQYADVPGAAAWTPSTFSLEIIARPSQLPDNRTIWSTQGLFTGWWLNTGPFGGLRIHMGDGSAWRFDPDGPILNPGTTYHIVATYDGTNARIYLNGVLVSTSPSVTMAPNNGANVMRFGAFSTGPGQYWPGTLDEASFYSAVLTPAQVQAHYQAVTTGSQAMSSPTGVVAPVADSPPANTSVPVVSGVAQQGQTLTASTGTWSGTAPIAYGYRWQRCSPGCLDIAGASGSSYLVAAADVGATLRAVVTASNSAGSSEAASAQTALVTAAGETTVTFSIGTGGDDGDIQVTGNQPSGYPPSGSPAANSTNTVFTVGRRLAFGQYRVLVGLLRFDTSALPDNATVTSAKLRLSVIGKADSDDRGVVGEWYGAGNWPIDSGDWTLNPGTTAFGAADLTGLAINTTVELPLSGPGNISLAGPTALRLGISGGEPTADNYLQLATLEHTTRTEPQLVVSYTTP